MSKTAEDKDVNMALNKGYKRLDINGSAYHIEYKPGHEHDFMVYRYSDRDAFLELNLVRDMLFMILEQQGKI